MPKQTTLTYGFTALEPYIDAGTMEVHYTGHHATYAKVFGELIESVPGLKGKTVEQILENLDDVPHEYRDAVRNNGGGFLNHNLYFESLSPNGHKEPMGALKQQIDKDFGDFEALIAQLKKAALTQFGSGYAWLVYSEKEGRLLVKQTGNQESPMMDGETKVLLPIDVWEHAYYLKYRNKRAEYVDALFHVIDWSVVGERYEKARNLETARA